MDAAQQIRQLLAGPAVAAIEHGEHRFAHRLQCFQGIQFHPGDVSIQHQQHQVGMQRDAGGQACSGRRIDLIDAWCVDQVHGLQPRNRTWPGHRLLMACAAMGDVGGHHVLTHQRIDQAGLAHTHPAEHRDAQPVALEPLQLQVQQAQGS